jgi:hypothetical protein
VAAGADTKAAQSSTSQSRRIPRIVLDADQQGVCSL